MIPAEVDPLCAAWFDGALDEAGMSRLTALVQQDPDVRAHVASLLAIDHALGMASGTAPSRDEFLIRVCSRLRPRRQARRRPWLLPLAVAAAAVIALGTGVWWSGSSTQDPRLIGPAEVAPTLAGDDRVHQGQRIATSDHPARIVLADHAEILVRPYTTIERGSETGLWLLQDGAVTVRVAPGSGPLPVTVRTPHGQGRLTGTILHASASPQLSCFSVERGHVAVSDGSHQADVGAGSGILCGTEVGWTAFTPTSPPQRAFGNAVVDEDILLQYRQHGPLLTGTTATDAGPARSLAASDLVAGARSVGLTVRVDTGVVSCVPGTGEVRFALPRSTAVGVRLRLQARIATGPDPAGFALHLVEPSAKVVLPDWLRVPAVLADQTMGSWTDLDLRILRIGRTAEGLPLWEMRLQIGSGATSSWGAGEWPVLLWRLDRAGLEFREVRISDLRRQP